MKQRKEGKIKLKVGRNKEIKENEKKTKNEIETKRRRLKQREGG